MTLIFATGNTNKVKEIKLVLPDTIKIQSLADIGFTEDIPETRDTIEGNSSQKAHYLKDKLGVDCFSEDTGLEVEALNGAPGVKSARYAGPGRNDDDNMHLLLENLRGESNRKAQFKTVITLLIGNEEFQFEGVLKGVVGYKMIGEHGFGYDPIFQIEDGRSLAELNASEKAAISHRAVATAQLVDFLQNRYI
ncbi:MAG: RdgB/HAM1 family non-canonical purine NTP pyrophosphatase [Bacteroidetes bacterium]|nr:RdgB/HAM1 family non-canonical purine NTP pyrophosphatase [Bacteroidota bacterium]